MQSNIPPLLTLNAIEPGEFFIFIDLNNEGVALCLKAAFIDPGIDDGEPNRVVPIHWPENQSSVLVPMVPDYLHGRCIKPEDAKIVADLTSLTRTSPANDGKIIQTRDGFFMPLTDRRKTVAYVNVSTGEITPILGNPSFCYSKWSITISDGDGERRTIFDNTAGAADTPPA